MMMKILSLSLAVATSTTTAFQVPQQALRPASASTTKTQAIAMPLPGLVQQQQVETTTKDEQPPRQKLAAPDQWIANLDYVGFGKEVTALGRQLQAEGGTKDVQHLQKMVLWRNACALVGLATCWMAPNPLTVAALSTWTYASWAMIAHHTCHGGYNRLDAGNFNSRGFALGSVVNRAKDWLDWMQPEGEYSSIYSMNDDSDRDMLTLS
jgi:hypothetical protein